MAFSAAPFVKSLYPVGKEEFFTKIDIRFFDESNGTIKMFTLAPSIIFSLLNGTTLVIDEIDAKFKKNEEDILC